MQVNFNELKFYVGDLNVVEDMKKTHPLQPFSDEVLEFLSALSKKLMVMGKEYPDVVTFAFWCRKAAMQKEKQKYTDLDNRLGRGIAFHSTPSNVPVNCAFSFASALLAGNANLVRLPAKDFPQVEIICNAINSVISEGHEAMIPYICMFKYPPIKEISDYFSSVCDSRIVWGGDNTIAEMRASKLKARANEVTFADRHSAVVINADEYLNEDNKERVAQDFYNDSYYSDQNACTAPRIVIWTGKEKEKAKCEFWKHLHRLVKEKYTFTPVQSVGKLSAFYRLSSNLKVEKVSADDEFITRIKTEKLYDNIMDYKYNSGFFIEYDANNLEEILPICDNKCQTITYFGLDKDTIMNFYKSLRPFGVDRFVPMGKSMDFTLVWDGYDLIYSLSRKFSVI